MHLKAGELVDLAEGTRAESSAPHLATCDACRRELAALKQTLALATAVSVPEPSPLFWDHLSRRVSDAVTEDRSRPPSWWRAPRFVIPVLVAAAAIVVAVAINGRDARPNQPASTRVASIADPHDSMPEPQAGDDPSLVLVSELTSQMDLDGATEAGLAPQGSAEHAVTHMSHSELRELQRLLTEELANSGA
jgi:anti-sigma factor RsiW